MKSIAQTDRKGFTLIELVIVIAIVAVIVVMSFASYASYRKSISLSLAVDSLQSAVKSVQQQSRSGKGMLNGASVPLCYGLLLEKGKPVRYVTATYKDASNSVNASEFPCDLSTANIGRQVDLMEGIQVAIDSDATVYAVPPQAELFATSISAGTSILHFQLQYGADASKAAGVKMSLPFGALEKTSL